MKKIQHEKTVNDCCCGPTEANECNPMSTPPLPAAVMKELPEKSPCCGPKQGPPASIHERPGYALCNFVDGFAETKVGPVPRLKNKLDLLDIAGTLRARLGWGRDQYKVSPGLYSVGCPSPDSPVMVTANYKLTLDTIREDTEGVSAWILVLDTRGVNVWCAAGKKNFSTAEIIRQVQAVELHDVVRHRKLILPQLGAPGVASHLVKKGCGFNVLWGPVKSSDIKQYLKNGNKATMAMRSVTFTLYERIILVPVEIYLILKPSLYVLAAIFLLSGFCSNIFSIDLAISRGLLGAASYGMGLLAGAVMVPALLPKLPFRSFYLKGIVTGLGFGVMVPWVFSSNLLAYEKVSLLLLSCSVSSFAAMNFTGTTPYTSPSGVEKEMRRGIPLQSIALICALVMWLWAGFIR